AMEAATPHARQIRSKAGAGYRPSALNEHDPRPISQIDLQAGPGRTFANAKNLDRLKWLGDSDSNLDWRSQSPRCPIEIAVFFFNARGKIPVSDQYLRNRHQCEFWSLWSGGF